MSTDTRTPTLEELIQILRLAKNFRINSMEGTAAESDVIRVSFTVSKKDCEDNNVNVRTIGSLFHKSLIDYLDKLYTFEDLTKRYSNPDEKGSTAADCVHFLNNELRHIPPGGLEGTLRRRFFSTIVNKLTELQEWRVFVDHERFEELRKQQAKEKAAREEAERQRKKYQKEQEEAHRRKQQEHARNYGQQENARNYGQQENARNYGQQENARNYGFGGFSEEEMARARQKFEDAYRSAFGNGFGCEDPFSQFRQHQGRRSRYEEEQFKYKPASEPGKKWWEILGVPANANKATIKSAWRKLAKQFHPDREGGSNARMAEINAAKDEGLSGAPA